MEPTPLPPNVVEPHTCWKDECKKAVLVPTSKLRPWCLQCPVCHDAYTSCVLCPTGLDWDDNEKGITCVECDRHFCIGCWPNVDKGSHSLGDGYTCSECVKPYTARNIVALCCLCNEELRKDELWSLGDGTKQVFDSCQSYVCGGCAPRYASKWPRRRTPRTKPY
jgi:hypothetical protein